ncbi:MAG: hypothetical protein M3P83_05360, partial [Actinomycetota bacterium]|nr:hypothetical protein [Actinomycetota bacterium]
MAERIILHIGAPKTGTTFLQEVLFGNRDRLRAAGVLVPGRSRFDHGLAAGGVRQGPHGRRHANWRQIVRAAHEWSGTVIISNEWFSRAGARQAERAVQELGIANTHVVFTARDFVEQIPAAWQETLKIGESCSLDDFLQSLDRERGRWRWSVLDPAVALKRWRGDLPVEQVHVVTVPSRGSDPDLLWRRFAQLCGVDPVVCDTRPDRVRESLSAESASLLQLLGPSLREAIAADDNHWTETYRWLQRYLSHQLLVPMTGSRIRLRPEQVTELRDRSWVTVQALTTARYDVVGDLAELTSAEPPPGARHPDDITDRERLDVAMHLVADLLRDVREASHRAE